jgi:hypothetical protein
MTAIVYPIRTGTDRPSIPRRPSGAPRVAGRPAVSPPVARRRRQVVMAAVLLLAASAVWALGGLLGWLGSGPLAAPGPDPMRAVPAAAVVHVVQPGETVWSIARAAQPKGEVRPLVDRLERELHGRPLQVGDRLTLD